MPFRFRPRIGPFTYVPERSHTSRPLNTDRDVWIPLMLLAALVVLAVLCGFIGYFFG